MDVDVDFICEHGFPKPWVTCMECMYGPAATRPVPPREAPAPPRTAAKSGRMPTKASEGLPKLTGDRDMSYAVHDIGAHMKGPGNDWLFALSGLPRQLRAGGWVYLRSDGHLGARARVTGIGFREERVQQTGEPEDQGPGATIELDASTWEKTDHDLGELASSQRKGYRYLIACTDGSIRHLSASEPIPGDIDVDPPAKPSK